MNRQAFRLLLMWGIPVVAGGFAAHAWLPADSFNWQRGPARTVAFPVEEVVLPVSSARFPAGAGSDIANAQCLICHSVGMVTRQPPLTREQWAAISNKMRTAYGAPLPADQVDALAAYLYGINGRPADPKQPAQKGQVDMQGS
jgi:mono/diheme cytochrome c family protein